MKMNVFKRVILIIFLVLILTINSLIPASSQQTQIDNGISWLLANQNPDSSWGGQPNSVVTPFHATTAVANTLQYLGVSNSSLSDAIEWISTQPINNIDYLSWKIEVLANSGKDISQLLNTLISSQNADGGWGLAADYQSDVLDTVLTLRALAGAGYTDSGIIRTALNFLMLQQHKNGGFGFEEGSESIYLTALTLFTLSRYQTAYNLTSTITNATDWLLSQQNIDNSFGESIYETALSYSALIRTAYASAAVQNALSHIKSSQLANGSWNDNAYETALALKALYDARPNLFVGPSAIVFSPAEPYEGDMVNLSVAVYNTGPVSADNIVIQFFLGYPNTGTKISERIIPQIEGFSSVIIQTSWLTTGYVGPQEITVVVDPNNTIDELSENDNQATRTIKILANKADLVVESISFSPPYPTEANLVIISATVTNQGVTAASNIEVAFYDGDQKSGGVQLGSVQIDKLTPGGSREASITWDTTDKPGTHNIYAIADLNEKIPEVNETNNTLSKSIEVAPIANLSDLAITAISFSNYWPNVDEEITINATVTNEGLVGATNVSVRFYDGQPDQPGSSLIGEAIISSVPSKTTAVAQVLWKATPQGEHKIYVQVDPENTIREGNENNNGLYTTIMVGILPDLSISAEDISFSHTDRTQGLTVIISATIHNRGNATSPNVLVNFYDGAPEDSNNLIAQALTDSVAPQQSQTITLDWLPQAGTHIIHVKLDPDNYIPELNETNNLASKQVEITVPQTLIILYKITGEERQESYTYSAHEKMQIELRHIWEDVFIIVWIEDEKGTPYPLAGSKELGPVGLYKPGETFWLTLNHSPGSYRVIADIISSQTGTLIEEKTKAFTIQPIIGISFSYIYPSQRYVYLTELRQINLLAELRNGSNVDSCFRIDYEVLSPSAVLITSGSKQETLTAEQWLKVIELDTFTHEFTEVGDYKVNIEVYDEQTQALLSTASSTITCLPLTRVEVEKKVTPQNLYPDGQKEVNITIELEGINEE